MAKKSGEARVRPYEPFPPFVEWSKRGYNDSVFVRYEEQLDAARESATPESLAAALDRAMRWAAVDTGAIEALYEVDRGFTFTVAMGAAAWESIEQVKGVDAARAINDAMKAYEGVLDAATASTPISEAWIRGLHEIACASQDTYTVVTPLGPQQRELVKGKYKTDPNSPLNLASNEIHSYASPSETPHEMQRLVEQFRSEEFASAHPVLQAAYAHYGFVAVHPFADGNGRVARALASVFLYRRPGVPLVVFVDQKPEYLDALERADNGDPDPFVTFIGERAIETMALVRDEFGALGQPNVEQNLADIEALLMGRDGLEHTAVDAAAARLLSAFEKALKVTTTDEVPSDRIAVHLRMIPDSSGSNSVPGYRSIRGGQAINLMLVSSPPSSLQTQRIYQVEVARPTTEGADLVVATDGRMVIDARIKDVHPIVSKSLSYRLETIAKREVSTMLGELKGAIEADLRKRGYL